MGVWDDIGKAEIFERGHFIKAGFEGVLLVKKTILKQTRKSGLAFIVEFEVLESNLEAEHKIGSTVSWFQKLVDQNVAFPAVAEWACATAGIDPHDKEKTAELIPELPALLEHATAEENEDDEDSNDFIGQRVRVKTSEKTTQNDKIFTLHEWKPYVAD